MSLPTDEYQTQTTAERVNGRVCTMLSSQKGIGSGGRGGEKVVEVEGGKEGGKKPGHTPPCDNKSRQQ